MIEFKTYTQDPHSGVKPKKLVILLHGVGANGQDLISLAPYFAQSAPDAVFISPDAPHPCDMAPGMPNSFQWFSLQDRDADVMLKGAQDASRLLNTYIDKMLQQYDLEDKDLALIGFSQGTMTALYAGLRRANPIAGIIGYSGALIGARELEDDNIQKTPIHLVHGEMDMVVPLEEYIRAKDALEKAGFTVTGETSPNLDHSIDEIGIRTGAEFLEKVLG